MAEWTFKHKLKEVQLFLKYFRDGNLQFEPMAEGIHHELGDEGWEYARCPDDLKKDFEDIRSYINGDPIKNRPEWKGDLDRIFKGFQDFLKCWIKLS